MNKVSHLHKNVLGAVGEGQDRGAVGGLEAHGVVKVGDGAVAHLKIVTLCHSRWLRACGAAHSDVLALDVYSIGVEGEGGDALWHLAVGAVAQAVAGSEKSLLLFNVDPHCYALDDGVAHLQSVTIFHSGNARVGAR